MKRLIMIAMGVATASLFGATYYADDSRPDDTGDGLTLETAKKYIQSAVDLTKAGDTVLVAPGVYDNGPTTRDSLVGGGNEARVVITNAITLKSIAGKEATHIVGAADPNGNEYGLGPNAVRCITVLSSKVGGTEIIGFTIRNGASHNDSKDGVAGANLAANWGGGVYGGSKVYTAIILVDCTVRDCVATRGGGAAYVQAVRTLFAHNRATTMGSAARIASAYNCIFTGQRYYSLCGFANVVNCTFAANDSYSFYWESNIKGACIVNCVSVGNEKMDTECNNITGVVYSSSVLWTGKDLSTMTFTTPPENLAGYYGDQGIVFSPATGDFRPRAGSILDGTGSVAGLDLIPEKYRDTDFAGNPRKTGETVCIGALETTAVPATQTLKFSPSSGVSNLVVNGVVASRHSWLNSETWPAQVTIKPEMNPGKELFAAKLYPAQNIRFPKEDGTYVQTLPPAGCEKGVDVLTNTFIAATHVYWTDPTADAAAADGTKEHPYRTLQEASSAGPNKNSSKYIIVHCKPGVYDEGGQAFTATVEPPRTYQGSNTLTNRLYVGDRNMFFRSTEGAARTVIQGRWDNESGIDDCGTGPAAVRCVMTSNSSYIFGLMGFTLKDGAPSRLATYSDKVNNIYDYGDATSNGGAVYMKKQPTTTSEGRAFNHTVMDCVITNCSGSRGAAANGGQLRRCTISGCHTTSNGSGWFRSASMASCVVHGGEGTAKWSGMLGQGTHCWNCTAVATDKYCSQNAGSAFYYGCVFDGLSGGLANPVSGYENIGCLNGTTKNVTSMPSTNALLAASASGDCRPCADSPAIGLLDPTLVTNFCYMVADDIDGNPLLVTDGKVTAGACQKPVPVLDVKVTKEGEITPSGRIVVTGDSIDFTVPSDTKRNYLGYEFGGVFTATSDRSFSWAPVADKVYTDVISARAVYSTNWYVNATSGNNSNDGWTPETARQTLVAGVADAVEGDIVHAAAGVYNSGSALQTSMYTPSKDVSIPCRAIVPCGVTLEGESAANTIIEGEPDPDTVGNTTHKGTGPKAIRGAWLDKRAKLRNFTIRNGYSNNGKLDRDDDCGGGVLQYSNTKQDDWPWVEDCIITNCTAGRGGGARFGRYNRVKFIGNTATVNGAAVREGSYYNCYFKNNTGGSLMLVFTEVENCTFDSGNAGLSLGATGNNRIYNSVFTTKDDYHFYIVSNCLFATGSTYTNLYSGGKLIAPEGSNREVDLADMKLTDGVPARDSVLVDAGDASLSDGNIGDRDLAGNPRISNANRMDVGAFEYDWRPDYAQALAVAGKITVNEADPAVRMGDDGRSVVIPADASLALSWEYATPMRRKYLTADVAEGGALTIMRNDAEEPLATIEAGKTDLRFKPDRFTDTFVFSSENAESAVSAFRDPPGLMLFVQ